MSEPKEYHELTGPERTYINGRASGLGVAAANLPPEHIGRMLERFHASEGALARESRALNYVAEQRRLEREKQEPPDPLEGLPTQEEAMALARKMNVLPQFIKTREQEAARLEAERQAQEAELGQQLIRDAVANKDGAGLVMMSNTAKDPELRAAARAAAVEVWPTVPDWAFD